MCTDVLVLDNNHQSGIATENFLKPLCLLMDGSVLILVPDEVDVNVLEEKGTSGATCTMTRCTSVKF